MPAKIDLKLNPPSDKRALTKENMLSYVKTYGTDEEKRWFKKLMKDNAVKKKNNLTGDVSDTYNFVIVREEFAKKFFPDISKKGKKEAKKKEGKGSKKPSFAEELENLI